MQSLRRYYCYFFILCLVLTMVFGVIAALLPQPVGTALTAFPYLISMIGVLFIFLNKQKRAPSTKERNHFALVFVLIFFFYNLAFALLGQIFFSMGEPEAWQNWWMQISNGQFIFILIAQLLIYMIPLYLVTFWFYGKQSHRMADKMFNS